jgi:hypothetical protein
LGALPPRIHHCASLEPMLSIDRQPTATDLKLFGASLSGLLAGIGAWFWLRTSWHTAAWCLWVAAAVLCATYYAAPRIQRPLYRGWLIGMFPLAWLMSTLVLGILFYGLVTPIGFISRLAGRDPLQLRTSRDSYWIARPTGPTPKSRYFRQH